MAPNVKDTTLVRVGGGARRSGRTLFNFAPPPPLERIEHVVTIAVQTFMAAYGKK